MDPSTRAPAADAFAPARLGPLTLRNRIIKAATFEGVMPRGAVTDELIEFHTAVARGGAALSTVAASIGGALARMGGEERRLGRFGHPVGALRSHGTSRRLAVPCPLPPHGARALRGSTFRRARGEGASAM